MIEDIFLKPYNFTGIHSIKVNELKKMYNEEDGLRLFNRIVDIYLLAPIVGFIYRRKSFKDTGEERTSIFSDVLIKEAEKIKYNYRLIMLLDDKYEPDFNKRLDKAFKYIGSEEAKEDFELYNSYVRGGVDILYKNLIENSKSPDDCINKIYDFFVEYQEIYNKDVTREEFKNLFGDN